MINNQKIFEYFNPFQIKNKIYTDIASKRINIPTNEKVNYITNRKKTK
jgi:hypothetical protein